MTPVCPITHLHPRVVPYRNPINPLPPRKSALALSLRSLHRQLAAQIFNPRALTRASSYPENTMYDPLPYRDTDGTAAQTRNDASDSNRSSMDSTSTTSLILERLNREDPDNDPDEYESSGRAQREKRDEDDDLEMGRAAPLKPMERKVRRAMYLLAFLMVGGWFLALIVYVSQEHFGRLDAAHDPSATSTQKAGKKITLNQVMHGTWRSRTHTIQWIDGPHGDQDGLLLTQNSLATGNFLEVQDVRNDSNSIVLMKDETLQGNGQPIRVVKCWPSSDLKKVLVASDYEKVGFSATHDCLFLCFYFSFLFLTCCGSRDGDIRIMHDIGSTTLKKLLPSPLFPRNPKQSCHWQLGPLKVMLSHL